MLQFGLEALLLAGEGAQPADSAPAAAKILRTLKRTRDASTEPQTDTMCALAAITCALGTLPGNW